MTVQIGQVYRVSFFATAGTQTAVNVQHIRIVAGGGTAEVAETVLADQLSADWAAVLKPAMSLDAAYWGVRIVRISPTVGQPYYSQSGAGAGAIAEPVLPRQVAGLIRTYIDYGGRRGRGRQYIPFPAVTDNESTGIPTGAYRTLLLAIGGVLVATVTATSGANSVQGKRVHRGNPADPYQLPYTTATVPRLWATQKRRGSFGRPNPPPSV